MMESSPPVIEEEGVNPAAEDECATRELEGDAA